MLNRMRDESRIPCEGRRLSWCKETFRRLCKGKQSTIEHKIGLAYDVKGRWEFYISEESSNQWRPDYLILLERPPNREATGYLEAALISWISVHEYYKVNSVNVVRCDLGGEGPRHESRSGLPHYIYIAIRLTG